MTTSKRITVTSNAVRGVSVVSIAVKRLQVVSDASFKRISVTSTIHLEIV